MGPFFLFSLFTCFATVPAFSDMETDLLIVGGGEAGCAAAIQAARMGVPRIILVNDIEWLGGQFSAEGLCAVDENSNTTGLAPGVRHQVPIPRSGLFKEVTDRIHQLNRKRYGHPRPGNTRVNTTLLPSDGNRVFHEMLQPYVDGGQIQILSHYYPVEVLTSTEEYRVRGVVFEPVKNSKPSFSILARLTIDASDWGDVIRLSGAAYEFGPDLKSKYGEPEAPENPAEYPLTDMNPITYTLVVVETTEERVIPRPPRYDSRVYDTSPYPRDHSFFYTSRRLIDHYNLEGVTHPDVVLLCTPIQDYPLDVLPEPVAEVLEEMEPGASKKNIVEMTRRQREVIFEDAKQHSLGLLYWLQTSLHDRMPNKTHSFRRFRLNDEFGTVDRLPWKPYVRESLRLKAMYMMRQQDTLGSDGDSRNFAEVLYYDGVACWQFEYDFHPTRRAFFDGNPAGPWQARFRKLRNWGPPYSGRANFPIRSLIPEKMEGLLGAEKNLGYSSIVSSAVRLHDHCMAVGQACGAVAAVALLNDIEPRMIPFRLDLIEQTREGLCHEESGVPPAVLCPFSDIETSHPAFVAINRLAARQILPLDPNDPMFHPDERASDSWKKEVLRRIGKTVASDSILINSASEGTRGEFALLCWRSIHGLPVRQPVIDSTSSDKDHDGIPDQDDPMPLDRNNNNLMDTLEVGFE